MSDPPDRSDTDQYRNIYFILVDYIAKIIIIKQLEQSKVKYYKAFFMQTLILNAVENEN